MRYVVVAEKAENIDFHLEGLREAGEEIPEPTAATEYVEV